MLLSTIVYDSYDVISTYLRESDCSSLLVERLTTYSTNELEPFLPYDRTTDYFTFECKEGVIEYTLFKDYQLYFPDGPPVAIPTCEASCALGAGYTYTTTAAPSTTSTSTSPPSRSLPSTIEYFNRVENGAVLSSVLGVCYQDQNALDFGFYIIWSATVSGNVATLVKSFYYDSGCSESYGDDRSELLPLECRPDNPGCNKFTTYTRAALDLYSTGSPYAVK
jgi:hypothetical protein